MSIKSRLKDLEKVSGSDQVVITMSLRDEDEAGNPIRTGMCVVGSGWSAKQADGESEEAFRARAKSIAAQNGDHGLWDGPCIEVTIGGEE
ncbi:hypothetical protein [Sedimentitalea nanhaiensis]|uniref:Uncharacterized protein n=1 Tax=Sedimentitalea nanhaiensis TaxID=999627 RepID=A0A1I7D525_9RHOB|nr:hypothetical protein [Sedimentitalea nanhaiensis]SFU06832.1 hypothetical protein SAMN05216236_12311 [Sedimentitalea nanhaiensis]